MNIYQKSITFNFSNPFFPIFRFSTICSYEPGDVMYCHFCSFASNSGHIGNFCPCRDIQIFSVINERHILSYASLFFYRIQYFSSSIPGLCNIRIDIPAHGIDISIGIHVPLVILVRIVERIFLSVRRLKGNGKCAITMRMDMFAMVPFQHIFRSVHPSLRCKHQAERARVTIRNPSPLRMITDRILYRCICTSQLHHSAHAGWDACRFIYGTAECSLDLFPCSSIGDFSWLNEIGGFIKWLPAIFY